MDDRVTVQRDWFRDYSFHLVEKIDQLKQLVDICVQRRICSLDLETTGVDNRVYPDEYFEDGRKTRHGIRTVDSVVGICISFDGENGYYIPVGHEPDDSNNLPWDPVWDEITRLCDGARIIFHNKKFDAEFLYPLIGREFWRLDQFEDTFLMCKVISPLKSNPAGLKPLSKTLFGIEMVELDELFTDEKKEQLKRMKVRYSFALLHPKEGLEYGCSDGIFTFKGYFAIRDRIKGFEKLYDLEKMFCNVVRKMERNRVHIDVDRVNQLFTDSVSALTEVGDMIRDLIEKKTGKTGRWLTLNVGSPTQLSHCFFTDQEGLKLKPTPEMLSDGEGGFSVSYDDGPGNDEVDEDYGGKPQVYSLADEVLKSLHRHYGEQFLIDRGRKGKDGKPLRESMFELILEYRHYDKMKGSYVEKLLKSHDKLGDVRPSFNQIGTETARLSCKAGKIEDGYSGVNFQGIPRDSDDDKPELFKQIRTVIVPRPGWILVKIDYAGEELRVITNMSGDPIWKKSFLHEDGDVHSITSRILFGKPEVSKDERNRGKRSNFAIIYGGGAGAISRNVGCTIEEGSRHMQNMREGLPELMGYVESQKRFAKRQKCVYTAFGRRMPIPTIDSQIKAVRRKAERCAINYTIQATSADILKFAMCYVDKQIRKLDWEDRVRYVLTVHDEVVYEVRPEHLMEVVRKLDEWMVLPWKVPKAHGRQWEVPLETEPGIDIHWRARFDYFQMVDGTPVDPKEIDSSGRYTGSLKKGQYFADGRVYQEIPDFLKAYIRRLSPAESDAIKEAQQKGIPWEMPKLPDKEPGKLTEGEEEKPELGDDVPPDERVTRPDPPRPPPDPDPDPEPPKDGRVEAEVQDPETVTGSGAPSGEAKVPINSGDDGFELETPPAGPKCSVCGKPQHRTPSGLTCPEGHGGADSVPGTGSEEDAPALDLEPAEPAPAAPDEEPASPPRPRRPVLEGEQVLRWVMTAPLTVHNLRKLDALFILAEGEMPLRVVGQSGKILMPEDHGVRVDKGTFTALAGLFGLG